MRQFGALPPESMQQELGRAMFTPRSGADALENILRQRQSGVQGLAGKVNPYIDNARRVSAARIAEVLREER